MDKTKLRPPKKMTAAERVARARADSAAIQGDPGPFVIACLGRGFARPNAVRIAASSGWPHRRAEAEEFPTRAEAEAALRELIDRAAVPSHAGVLPGPNR